MSSYVEVKPYWKGKDGPFGKWWYEARAVEDDGNYGVGFGASREAAVKRALQDLVKGGGRNPRPVKVDLERDGAGYLMCRDAGGHKYVLRGQRWVRSSG